LINEKYKTKVQSDLLGKQARRVGPSESGY